MATSLACGSRRGMGKGASAEAAGSAAHALAVWVGTEAIKVSVLVDISIGNRESAVHSISEAPDLLPKTPLRTMERLRIVMNMIHFPIWQKLARHWRPRNYR